MSNYLYVNNLRKIKQIYKIGNLLVYNRQIHDVIDQPEILELVTQNYLKRQNDPIEKKKARLLYQSRKRGMLENGLILSTFADRYLFKMSAEELDEYDKLINLPSNDWDIYNWAIGMKPTPLEFETNVMHLLREHVKNVNKEKRLEQPTLH